MSTKKPARRYTDSKTTLVILAVVALCVGVACYVLIAITSIADDIGKQVASEIIEKVQAPRDKHAEESRIRQRYERITLPADLTLVSSVYEEGSSGYPGSVVYTYTSADTKTSYENLKSVLKQSGYEVYVGADNSAFSASKNSGASLNVTWNSQTIVIKAQ